MDIQLTDDYRVITDPHNYILQKRNVVKDKESKNYGQETWNSISWHGKREHLISKLIDLEIKQSSVESFEALEQLIKRVESNILTRLEGVKQ